MLFRYRDLLCRAWAGHCTVLWIVLARVNEKGEGAFCCFMMDGIVLKHSWSKGSSKRGGGGGGGDGGGQGTQGGEEEQCIMASYRGEYSKTVFVFNNLKNSVLLPRHPLHLKNTFISLDLNKISW